MMRTALTIAGSDSGGGAGIQADLKSFAAVDVHGTSVITCVTSQNTRAVTSIFPLPAASIAGYLALGQPLLEAVESGRHRVASGFLTSYRAGRGVEIINSQYHPDRFAVAHDLEEAASALTRMVPAPLLGKGTMDLAYALPSAAHPEEIAVVRMTASKKGGPLESLGPASFGAPPSVSETLLAAMGEDPETRAAIHLKLKTRDAGRLRTGGLVLAPRVVKGAGVAPDAVVDAGMDRGGTTMSLLGRNPEDVVRKVRRFARM